MALWRMLLFLEYGLRSPLPEKREVDRYSRRMIKPRAFRRIADCDRCLFASDHPVQPCLARFKAPSGESCLDFRPLPLRKPQQHRAES